MSILTKLSAGVLNKTNNRFYKRRAIDGYFHMCEGLHRVCEPVLPSKDPHEYLMTVLGLIWIKSGVLKESQLGEPDQFGEILNYTLIPACITPPFQQSILAYKLIREDKELFAHLISEYASFHEESEKHIQTVLDAKDNGTLKELYTRYNKSQAYLPLLFPSENGDNKRLFSFDKDEIGKRRTQISESKIGIEIMQYIGKAEKTIDSEHLIFSQ
ncbi:MAG: hypothetical protein D8M57_10100 [Candidatus Scalindua sp. AMX11]|nr:MAG: hypothetical protein DWQ00_08850 [Candidatus Scalindua sp.]NOG84842.1 hypothetical protein [Planctomycetota bacterium]RZV84912.1 MAG: hypothetical protein EX341_07850 [Candidatus Scalindua sp. SCAELEC01]TDE65097.1 MAG: hypothetical protein D8M57_10100 [Candidatus Scalindua sp. AMX11]GJQ59489.1 MAG: hypothetical protein SCALA701_22900 [Candidatus Scalindua sp.]